VCPADAPEGLSTLPKSVPIADRACPVILDLPVAGRACLGTQRLNVAADAPMLVRTVRPQVGLHSVDRIESTDHSDNRRMKDANRFPDAQQSARC